MNQRNKPRHNTPLRRTKGALKKVGWGILGIIVGFALLLLAVDNDFCGLFGLSPGFDEIKAPVVSEASEAYSADGKLIGRYYNENRQPVRYDDLPQHLVQTLIDTEDERFFHHHGIDFLGLMAATKDIAMGRARGGSTITQQLAKNLFRVRTQYSTGSLGKIPGVKILVMKLKEWIVALKLEKVFTKEEILAMYFNTVDFGSNAYGIKTAARTYFGCRPGELTYEQCATLVGLLKATSTYNPRINPRNSMTRRNLVLSNLYNHGHMTINGRPATASQLDSIQQLPLTVENAVSEKSQRGPAPYFREAIPAWVDRLCDEELVEGCDRDNHLDIYADGLKIYTSLDTRMQQMAEEAVMEQMQLLQERFRQHWWGQAPWRDEHYREIPGFIEDLARRTETYKSLMSRHGDERVVDSLMNLPHPVVVFDYQKGADTLMLSAMDSIRHTVSFLHTGFVVLEPHTRQVKAWVGDIDFDSWQYDKVLASRQPGSTFKLFVYAEAMRQGLTPVDTRLDAWHAYPDTIDGRPTTWAPGNANGYFSNRMLPLKSAFAQSINSVAVGLGYELGIQNVAQTAHAMGIESRLSVTPALALGASDVNLLELVNGYATAVNDGYYAQPTLITKIVDRHGKTIYQADRHGDKRRQALDYRSAYYMQRLLRGGLTEPGGTTAALWQWIHPICNDTDFGGKTGTSNNHSDAWFVGVTPHLVGGAWVGGEYRCIHFRTGELGQGSRTALPIFGRFMNRLLQDKRFSRYAGHFAEPKEAINQNTYIGPSVLCAPPDSTLTDSVSTEAEAANDDDESFF